MHANAEAITKRLADVALDLGPRLRLGVLEKSMGWRSGLAVNVNGHLQWVTSQPARYDVNLPPPVRACRRPADCVFNDAHGSGAVIARTPLSTLSRPIPTWLS